MTFKLGNTNISKIYLGSTEITRAYLGSNQVFSKQSAIKYKINPAAIASIDNNYVQFDSSTGNFTYTMAAGDTRPAYIVPAKQFNVGAGFDIKYDITEAVNSQKCIYLFGPAAADAKNYDVYLDGSSEAVYTFGVSIKYYSPKVGQANTARVKLSIHEGSTVGMDGAVWVNDVEKYNSYITSNTSNTVLDFLLAGSGRTSRSSVDTDVPCTVLGLESYVDSEPLAILDEGDAPP